MGSVKYQIAALAAGAFALAFSAPALADEPPPPVPPTPSIDQYVETVPTSQGGSSAGVGKPHAKPLPHRVTKKLRARRDAVTKRLQAVATSSIYGAPQQDLSRPTKTKASRPKTSANRPKTSATRRPMPAEKPVPRPTEPKAANPLSAAISAVSDSSDSHVFWLLGAMIIVTTAMVWATARRHRA
jgi:hypothetical protein